MLAVLLRGTSFSFIFSRSALQRFLQWFSARDVVAKADEVAASQSCVLPPALRGGANRCFSHRLDLNHMSPDSGERQYK